MKIQDPNKMIVAGKGTRIWHPELSTICEGVRFGENCRVHSHVWIGKDVKIGNNVKIQAFCFIPEGVIIGDDCFIGPRVTFTNDKNPPSGKDNWLPTVVGNGVTIGAGAVLLPGIVLEDNCTVGAGSIVTRNVLSEAVVYGNPARIHTKYKGVMGAPFNP